MTLYNQFLFFYFKIISSFFYSFPSFDGADVYPITVILLLPFFLLVIGSFGFFCFKKYFSSSDEGKRSSPEPKKDNEFRSADLKSVEHSDPSPVVEATSVDNAVNSKSSLENLSSFDKDGLAFLNRMVLGIIGSKDPKVLESMESTEDSKAEIEEPISDNRFSLLLPHIKNKAFLHELPSLIRADSGVFLKDPSSVFDFLKLYYDFLHLIKKDTRCSDYLAIAKSKGVPYSDVDRLLNSLTTLMTIFNNLKFPPGSTDAHFSVLEEARKKDVNASLRNFLELEPTSYPVDIGRGFPKDIALNVCGSNTFYKWISSIQYLATATENYSNALLGSVNDPSAVEIIYEDLLVVFKKSYLAFLTLNHQDMGSGIYSAYQSIKASENIVPLWLQASSYLNNSHFISNRFNSILTKVSESKRSEFISQLMEFASLDSIVNHSMFKNSSETEIAYLQANHFFFRRVFSLPHHANRLDNSLLTFGRKVIIENDIEGFRTLTTQVDSQNLVMRRFDEDNDFRISSPNELDLIDIFFKSLSSFLSFLKNIF